MICKKGGKLPFHAPIGELAKPLAAGPTAAAGPPAFFGVVKQQKMVLAYSPFGSLCPLETQVFNSVFVGKKRQKRRKGVDSPKRWECAHMFVDS